MATPPQSLLDSLRSHRCMLFVGSGLSVPAGYPTWPELVTRLVDGAVADRPEKAVSLKEFVAQQKDPLLVAEYTRGLLGPQRYGSLLRSIFNRKPEIQPVHRDVARTNYRAIITTNYDKVIETAFTLEHGWTPAVFTSFESVPSLGSALFDGQFFVFKLHGDISSAGSIVLTSQDYDALMFRSSFVRSFLQAIFLGYSLLFVGYGLADPDFQLVLKELHLIFEGTTPLHYALLPDPHVFTSEHLMSKMNIRVIPYDSQDGHREAADFLRGLQAVAPFVGPGVVPAPIAAPAAVPPGV